MDFSPLQLQLLPDALKNLHWYLYHYGAVWPHTFRLSESEVADLIELGIARTLPVAIDKNLYILLVAGPRLRQYTNGAKLRKTPVIQHAAEMASLIDLAMPFYQAGGEVQIDRQRRWIRAGDNEDYYMIRLRPPTIRTLARNERDESVILYVPSRHVKSLEKRAERAELYAGYHHKLIIRPFDADSWPPHKDDI